MVFALSFALAGLLYVAGGLGINLTAADTVVIYDSDWVRKQLEAGTTFLHRNKVGVQ